MAGMGIDGISEILGDKADDLLGHTCTTIDKDRLHLPGPDFVERVMRDTDRSVPVLRNLQNTDSVEVRVLVPIGRCAAAQQAEVRMGRNLVPGAGWNQNRVARCDFALLAVEFHGGCALEDEVDLLGHRVVVAHRGRACGQGGLGEALIPRRRMHDVEEFADCRAVGSHEWFRIGVEVAYLHG